MLNLNSRERSTSVVHTSTRVLILRSENKTSNIATARNMDTKFKNVTARTDKTSITRTAIKWSHN